MKATSIARIAPVCRFDGGAVPNFHSSSLYPHSLIAEYPRGIDGGVLSFRFRSVSKPAVYLLLGLSGIPVFANFTATAKIVGPTGGYLVGYLFLALTAALF